MNRAFVRWGQLLLAEMLRLRVGGKAGNYTTAAGAANHPALRRVNRRHIRINLENKKRKVNRVLTWWFYPAAFIRAYHP